MKKKKKKYTLRLVCLYGDILTPQRRKHLNHAHMNYTIKMKQNHTFSSPVITTVYYSNVTIDFTGKWGTSRGVSGPVSVFVNALIKTEGRESLKTITLSKTKGSHKDCAANTYS